MAIERISHAEAKFRKYEYYFPVQSDMCEHMHMLSTYRVVDNMCMECADPSHVDNDPFKYEEGIAQEKEIVNEVLSNDLIELHKAVKTVPSKLAFMMKKALYNSDLINEDEFKFIEFREFQLKLVARLAQYMKSHKTLVESRNKLQAENADLKAKLAMHKLEVKEKESNYDR